MNKLLKNIPVIIMLVMIVQFFIFAESLFTPEVLINTDFIFLTSSDTSAGIQKIIVTIFLIIVLCMPIYLSESKILSYIYCGIVIVGTVIFGEKFFAYMVAILSLPSMFVGGIGEILLAIIRFIFPKFNGVWIVWIAQLIGHIVVVGILAFPGEAIKGLAEEGKDNHSTSVQREDIVDRTLTGFVEGIEEVQKEQHEKEKLETLKDIDYRLKNLDHRK